MEKETATAIYIYIYIYIYREREREQQVTLLVFLTQATKPGQTSWNSKQIKKMKDCVFQGYNHRETRDGWGNG